MASPITKASFTSLRSSSRPATMAVSIEDFPNRFLMLGTASVCTTSNPNEITSAKWNGTSLIQYLYAASGVYNTYGRWKWWYLRVPEYGDYNLEFTYNHATREINIHFMVLSLFNVKDQAPRTGALGTGTGAGPISVSPTSVENDWVIDVGGLSNFNSSWTPQSSQNVEYNVWSSVGIGGIRGALGHKVAGAGSTTTMQWDPSGTINKFGLTAAAIEGVSPGGSKMILVMSSIYDRIQENRKKLGIGDLEGFKRGRNGLWKPQSGLVTI